MAEGNESQTMRRGSHTACPVGRRIVSLIPLAQTVPSRAFALVFVATAYLACVRLQWAPRCPKKHARTRE
eukprot:939238-Pyramimonas_sp.AAC.1